MANGLNLKFLGIFLSLVMVCVASQYAYGQQGLTQWQGEVSVSSTFGASGGHLAIDGDPNTNWTSKNPLPDLYLSQPHNNILLSEVFSSSSGVSLFAATDGDLNSATPTIPQQGEFASFAAAFGAPYTIHTMGIRAGGLRAPLEITLQIADGTTHIVTYPQTANYQHVRFPLDGLPVVGIELSSRGSFFVYEIGAVSGAFQEFVTLDLGEAKKVKEIRTKHWAGNGNALAAGLFVGIHTDSLIQVAVLDPGSLEFGSAILPEAITARYIRVVYDLVPQNFKKVTLFELQAFGSDEDDPATGTIWNPDAGIYPPLSKEASVIASSAVTNPAHRPEMVIDNNFATSWTSDNPLPDRYLANPKQNVFFGLLGTSSNGVTVVNATDGSLTNQTPGITPQAGGAAWYRLTFEPTPIRRLNLRLASGAASPVLIELTSTSGEIFTETYPVGSNANRRYVVEMEDVVDVRLSSPNSFAIQEIGAYATPLSESVTVDLGEEKQVSWIRTRHWNGIGNSLAARLMVGMSLDSMELVEELDPSRLDQQLVQVDYPRAIRYVQVEHDIVDEDFKKAAVQEITVFDKYGTYGPPPAPRPQQHSFAELFGLNTVWAWGTNKIPSLQGPDEGAQKFNRVASQARNYHNIHWDTTDPDNVPSYDPDNLNLHMQWTQWHREYRDWKNKGFTVDATFTFDRFPETAWDTPFESAYNLGRAFGSTFGSANLGLVRTVEVGNEPWSYSDSTYVKILEGMAKGLKEADPSLKVLPAALQASGWESGNTGVGKNYMGFKLSEQAATFLDGVNLHLYSYTRNEKGTRIAVHPEHPESSMQALFAGIRFRDANMPGKEVHVTEWGWDASSANEQAVNKEAVSEMSQAVYALRGLFWLSRMGVDRAHWYFYANVDVAPGKTPLNYDRSGLTESRLFNFREKRAFIAVESMQKRMGDLFFDEVIREDEQAYIYALRNAQGEQSHLIAWRPVAGEDSLAVNVPLSLSGSVSQAWYLSGLEAEGEEIQLQKQNGQWMLPLSSIPLLIKLGEDETSSPNSLSLRVEVLEDEVNLIVTAKKPVEEEVALELWEGRERKSKEVNWIRTDALVWKARIRKMPPGRYEFSATAGPGLASNEVSASVQPWFSLHPNPASDRTVLKLSHPLAEESTVSIIAPDGQVYGEFSLPAYGQELELSLPHLKEGFYLVKLVNGAYFGNTKLLKR